jgi:hypothetical protein
MPHPPAALLKGTLDLLILKALSTGELHGVGVSRRIKQMTGGRFVVQPGSLFPALHASRKLPGSPPGGPPPTTIAGRSTTRSRKLASDNSRRKPSTGTELRLRSRALEG